MSATPQDRNVQLLVLPVVSPFSYALESSIARILVASGANMYGLEYVYSDCDRIGLCSDDGVRKWVERVEATGVKLRTRPSLGSGEIGYRDGTVYAKPGRVYVFTGPAVNPVTEEPTNYIGVGWGRWTLGSRRAYDAICDVLYSQIGGVY